MRPLFFLAAAAPLALLATPARAQLIAPGNTVLLATYTCDAAQLTRADELVRRIAAPVLDRYVAQGKLLTWGYTGTYLGGPENRSIYVWARDPVSLIQTRQEYLPEILAKTEMTEFSRICGASEVTVHNLIVLGAPPPARP